MKRWLERAIDVPFPTLRKAGDAITRQRRLEEDVKEIQERDWILATEMALAEARRIADAELERRKLADSRAATYLASTAALIPLALAIEGAAWEQKLGNTPAWINAIGVGVAVCYVSMAGIWCFRTLRVSASHRVDVGDLTRYWGKADPPRELVVATLIATRLNRDGVNWKVSCVKMAHEHLFRAFATFACLLLVNVGSAALSGVRQSVKSPSAQVSNKNGATTDKPAILRCPWQPLPYRAPLYKK